MEIDFLLHRCLLKHLSDAIKPRLRRYARGLCSHRTRQPKQQQQ